MDILAENESLFRGGAFLTLLIIFALAEVKFPLAKRKFRRIDQWFTNLSIMLIATLSVHIVLPMLAVGVAYYASSISYGFFNLLNLPNAITIILSLLLLDLLIYCQHRIMHSVPLLWKLHRMHHTELALDVTSAVRFHPIEIILSMLIKMLFVFLMGIPVVAVILFEIMLNGLALFNHSNLKINKTADKWLRKCLVTPEVHWIHHSIIGKETNSNYGFNLVIWDKIFKTYIDKPKTDYPLMPQGLPGEKRTIPFNLSQLLSLPFKKS